MSGSPFHFEIIEAEPPLRKEKPKRKRHSLFGALPFRQYALLALSGVTIGIVLALIFSGAFAHLLPPPPTPVAIRPSTIHRANPALPLGEPVNDLSYTSDYSFVVAHPSKISLNDFTETEHTTLIAAQKIDYSDPYNIVLLKTIHAGGKTFTSVQYLYYTLFNLDYQAQIDTGSTLDHPVDTSLAFSFAHNLVAIAGADRISLRFHNGLSVLGTILTHAQGTSQLSFMDNHPYLSAVLQYDPSPSATPGWETMLQVWDLQKLDANPLPPPTILISIPIFSKYADRAVFSANGRFFAYVAPNPNDPSSDVVHLLDLSHLFEVGIFPFSPTTRISALALDQYSLVVTQPSGDHYTLQAFHWTRNSTGFHYTSFGQSPSIVGSGANYLHLWADSRGLDFLDLGSNTLRNWIFD